MEVKMRIAICDDEKDVRELIGNKVHRICPEADIVYFATGEELLKAEEGMDILFLDIQMQGRNGMEAARELRKKKNDAILIFVTALEEYVFQAFDVGAFHYLVKPFDEKKFEAVLRGALQQWQSRTLPEKKPEEKYLMINSRGIHTRVLLEDIVYAEVFNRKVVLHRMDSDIEYYGKMSDLEAAAGEDFFRPHRAYLVNFNYVEKYDASTIYLERGRALMAKQKFPEFVKKYMKFNQRKRGL